MAVPDDFRKEMAMVGDWQVTSQRVVYDTPKREEDEDVKSGRLAIGIRKRKFEGQEEEDEAGETVVRRGWGSTTRTYPSANDEEDDLEVLLNNAKSLKRGDQDLGDKKPQMPVPPADRADTAIKEEDAPYHAPDVPSIKREESSDTSAIPDATPAQDEAEAAPIKSELGAQEPGVVFKKRKAKPMRQKE